MCIWGEENGIDVFIRGWERRRGISRVERSLGVGFDGLVSGATMNIGCK